MLVVRDKARGWLGEGDEAVVREALIDGSCCFLRRICLGRDLTRFVVDKGDFVAVESETMGLEYRV